MAEKESLKEDKQDRPGVSAESTADAGTAKAAKKTKADLAKFINEDVSLSPLRTFERDQLVDKIAVMFDIK